MTTEAFDTRDIVWAEPRIKWEKADPPPPPPQSERGVKTASGERRLIDRRQFDRCRPDGGAFLVTLCIFSIVAGAVGFVCGAWFGWCLQ